MGHGSPGGGHNHLPGDVGRRPSARGTLLIDTGRPMGAHVDAPEGDAAGALLAGEVPDGHAAAGGGQAMTVLTGEVRAALTGGHLAHLVTLNPDGSPQATVVWVGLEGDEIVSGHMGSWQKVRNVRRDPRVVLTMVTGGANDLGLAHYLIVRGTARVTEGGAAALLQRLAAVYLGPGVPFPPLPPGADPPPGYVLRITPTHVGGVGPWQEAH